MPLPQASPRALKHHREINIKGYLREDKLWDIEAHLTDSKPYTFTNSHRGHIGAGEYLHEMWLRLTVDDSLTVKDVEAATDNGPYEMCPEITSSYKQLIDEQIKPGWTKRTRQLFGGIKGCTHLLELLGPVATVAFQTVHGGKQNNQSKQIKQEKPMLLNSCHAYAADSSVVKQFHPEYYRPKK